MGAPHVICHTRRAAPRRTANILIGPLEYFRVPDHAKISLLTECGLPANALEEPDTPITQRQQLMVIARLLERMDFGRSVPHHALEVAHAYRLTHNICGLTLMYASSLKDCLRFIDAYPELNWAHSSRTVAIEAERAYVGYSLAEDLAGSNPSLRRYCETNDLAGTIRTLRDLVGPACPPLEVWLPFPPPPDHREIRSKLDCPVLFDAPQARAYFTSGILDAPPLLANPTVFRTYEKLAAQIAEGLRWDIPISEQVRRILTVSSFPGRDAVAAMLALSPRTLARRLDAEGTSYGELQREVRLGRARELLRDSRRPMAEIADDLGFSDAAAFSRAFRSWTGQTPSGWRVTTEPGDDDDQPAPEDSGKRLHPVESGP